LSIIEGPVEVFCHYFPASLRVPGASIHFAQNGPENSNVDGHDEPRSSRSSIFSRGNERRAVNSIGTEHWPITDHDSQKSFEGPNRSYHAQIVEFGTINHRDIV
jgi:hypothetical protein